MKKLSRSPLRRLLSLLMTAVLAAGMIPSAFAATYYVARPAEGDYYIVPEANANFALDVKGGGNAPAQTPIQLWEKNLSDAQIVNVDHVSGDWYRLVHKRTGLVFNIQGGNDANDARIWLWSDDGTDACYFRFIQVGSSYAIQSKLGKQRFIDLDNALCFSGSVVHLWDRHYGLSARWKLIPVSSGGSSASSAYFPRYTGSSSSIATALKSLGIDSSYAYRKQIAQANSISNYTGTASQNTRLLTLLKAGQLKKPGASSSTVTITPTPSNTATTTSSGCFPRYTGSSSSITTALNSLGIDSSYAYRKQIAQANSISNYTGTASQNTRLLSLLKAGQLKKPTGSSSGSGSSVSNLIQLIQPSDFSNLIPTGVNLSVSPKSKENGIQLRSTADQRSAAALNRVIDQYNVTSNTRYARTSKATYCNIFVWDVTRALSCEIPHWLASDGKTPASSTTRGAYEINVNSTYNWLANYGAAHGWTTVTAEEAQNRANDGYPTIAIWKNTSGGSGHIAILRPETDKYTYSGTNGPVIAQAGASNYSITNVRTGFGRTSSILYYTHA